VIFAYLGKKVKVLINTLGWGEEREREAKQIHSSFIKIKF